MDKKTPASKKMLTERLQQQTVRGGSFRRLSSDEGGSSALGAWFLGPKAENENLLLELVQTAVKRHADDRRRYFPADPVWLTSERKESRAYRYSVERLRRHVHTLLEELDGSVPFFSYRYQGHMLWDVTLPSVVGYFAAMLYNQNNVAAEASPVTTWLEMIAADELCRMLGYHVPPRDEGTGEYEPTDTTIAWGHITCDGSVANSEALWAARNLKYYALGLAAALSEVEALAPARELTVRLPSGETKRLIELSSWQLLNLEVDEVLRLRPRIEECCSDEIDLDGILAPYSLQDAGLVGFLRRFANDTQEPVLICPATAHYSWPKAAALLGLGRASTLHIEVDLDARLDIASLRQTLETCLRDKRPIITLVVVLGTTEESAVDPLAQVFAVREDFRRRGMDFWIHVDAAWGGYFASMLRESAEPQTQRTADSARFAQTPGDEAHEVFYGPQLVMSDYVQEQYAALGDADSITIDPHKAGYIPYPAGGLCYRNSAMRHLVAFSAPIVYHGGVDPTVGVFGIEGSKPGAAAAAVYLSHRVIRTDQSGYGLILGRCLWNSKRLYCALVTMARPNDPFRIVPFQRLPSERQDNPTQSDIANELRRIATDVVPKTNYELLAAIHGCDDMRAWFGQLGSDQVIVSYAFNFLTQGDRSPNRDPELMNKLNQRIFERLSLGYRVPEVPQTPLFVTSSQFDPAVYGDRLVGSFCSRLGVVASSVPIDFLLSTTMNPWLTDTAEGDFIPRLVDVLRKTVLDVIGEDPVFR